MAQYYPLQTRSAPIQQKNGKKTRQRISQPEANALTTMRKVNLSIQDERETRAGQPGQHSRYPSS